MVDRFHHPVAPAPPDQSYPGGRARPIALNPGVPGLGLQIPRPPHQAVERATPFSSISVCSSPASNISIMMSDPPTNSPFTSSWGMVGQSEDRKSVVQGQSVSVSVDLGGRRIFKKKNKHLK